MTTKHDDPLGEELNSFLEKKQYLDESESLDLMLATYNDVSSEPVNPNVFQSITSSQTAGFKDRSDKIIH
jgi:hypothetical protein